MGHRALCRPGGQRGLQRLPRLQPIAAGAWQRANYAFYGDAEVMDPGAGRWNLGGALRFENFEDFGATLNGKLAARYAFAEGLALRGSLSTGFRAHHPRPAERLQRVDPVQPRAARPGQQWHHPLDFEGRPAGRRRAPGRGEVAQPRAVGAVIGAGPFQLTADYFHVRVSDRLALTQSFELTEAQKAQLVAEGISSATNLAELPFLHQRLPDAHAGHRHRRHLDPRPRPAIRSSAWPSITPIRASPGTIPMWVNDTRIRQLQEGLPRYRWLIPASMPSGGRAPAGAAELLRRLVLIPGTIPPTPATIWSTWRPRIR